MKVLTKQELKEEISKLRTNLFNLQEGKLYVLNSLICGKVREYSNEEDKIKWEIADLIEEKIIK